MSDPVQKTEFLYPVGVVSGTEVQDGLIPRRADREEDNREGYQRLRRRSQATWWRWPRRQALMALRAFST
jgi:hypothetical protein